MRVETKAPEHTIIEADDTGVTKKKSQNSSLISALKIKRLL